MDPPTVAGETETLVQKLPFNVLWRDMARDIDSRDVLFDEMTGQYETMIEEIQQFQEHLLEVGRLENEEDASEKLVKWANMESELAKMKVEYGEMQADIAMRRFALLNLMWASMV
jgi:hypothetical protein